MEGALAQRRYVEDDDEWDDYRYGHRTMGYGPG